MSSPRTPGIAPLVDVKDAEGNTFAVPAHVLQAASPRTITVKTTPGGVRALAPASVAPGGP